ncbi:MAG: YjbF family lipoprotein [Pseudomonadota bacterium]|nr:YjbF family lipoprotein [Pseudomonadota bacterium]
MNTGLRIFGAGALALALAGCSGANQTKLAAAVLPDLYTTAERDIAALRVQGAIDNGSPVSVVILTDRGQNSVLVPINENRGVVTWLAVDGSTVSTRDGLIIATRGLGGDLLAADVSQTNALLQARKPGRVQRFHTELTGDIQADTRAFVCDITDSGPGVLELPDGVRDIRLMIENCYGAQAEFLNLYWIADTDGTILHSSQWLGPTIGNVTLRQLRP